LVNEQAVQLMAGATFTIATHPIRRDANGVSTTYQHLPQDVNVGDRILIMTVCWS
jgi:pyruvate kinase